MQRRLRQWRVAMARSYSSVVSLVKCNIAVQVTVRLPQEAALS